MDRRTRPWEGQLEGRRGATAAALAALQERLGAALPGDYLDFLRQSDGAVGVGPDLFAILDPAGEVPDTTRGYGASEFAPGLVVIGSDGCGNLLGIDTRGGAPSAMPYVVFDACDIGWGRERHRAGSLALLLEHLARGENGGPTPGPAEGP